MRNDILRNAARCRKCGAVIESKHSYDKVPCKCGAIFVYGGKEFVRQGGNSRDIQSLVITEYMDEQERQARLAVLNS